MSDNNNRSGEGGGLGGVSIAIHGRSVKTNIYPRIPTLPEARQVCTDQAGCCLHQARSAVRFSATRVKGELHPARKPPVRRNLAPPCT